jgi:S1-C subfamily serine protease
MASYPAGRQIRVRVQRKGDISALDIHLTRLPRPTWFGALIEPAEDDEGAEVMAVRDGSPAADAGLQRGDLIKSIDGVRYMTWLQFKNDALEWLYIDRHPGDEVKVRYRRGEDEARATLRLEPLPLQADAPLRDRGQTKAALGVQFGAPTEQHQGLVVVEVEVGSPAFNAGLRPGDLIVAVDGVEYQELQTFAQHLIRLLRFEKEVGDEIEMIYLRDGQRETADIHLEPDWPDQVMP